jgi:SSS family solute:Na+ symporter
VQGVNWTALTVCVVLFGFVSWLGFAAAHWRKGDLDLLHEWGLGGRRFGTVVSWFLIGGDLYTAYTFIAVPALAFGVGAVAFFAVPYAIVIYPILFLVFPRIWYVCRKHGYITAGDFVRGRFGNRWLALAVTLTGIVATMPYMRCSSSASRSWSARSGFPAPDGSPTCRCWCRS